MNRSQPDGKVAKTLCSQFRGPGFDPLSGNQIPQIATKIPWTATKARYSHIYINWILKKKKKDRTIGIPGRGDSMGEGQEVKESLVHWKPEWDLMGWVGKGDRASSWKARAGLRDLNFVLKATETYWKRTGRGDGVTIPEICIWEWSLWWPCGNRPGEGTTGGGERAPGITDTPGPLPCDDLQTHLALLLPPQAGGTSVRVARVFFGSCDGLSWCTWPPSPKAPLSRTSDSLMEVLLENLHQEICFSLVQIPSLPCSSKNRSPGEKNLGTQVMIEPDTWSHCPNHGSVWGCLLLWRSSGQWSQHPGAGTSPEIGPPPTGYSWETQVS